MICSRFHLICRIQKDVVRSVSCNWLSCSSFIAINIWNQNCSCFTCCILPKPQITCIRVRSDVYLGFFFSPNTLWLRFFGSPCFFSFQALGMLFWHKHNIEKSLADLPNFTPFPDEWTVEDKVLFEQAFSFHGKTFHRIQQMVSMIITIKAGNDC